MIVQKRDVWWWHKSNAALRELVARGGLAWKFDSLVVTEYPKSGGTWLSQMLGAASAIPYPRNRYPVASESVLHGCWLKVGRKHKTVALFRDGRDVAVSYYFHLVYPKEITSAKYSSRVRDEAGVLDPAAVHDNIENFIAWSFGSGFPGWSWADFVNRWWDDPNVVKTSYERLTLDPEAELERILWELEIAVSAKRVQEVVEQFSFESQSGRKRGDAQNESFIRRGVVGDWVNHFTPSAARKFEEYAGEELILAGYETDSSWIHKLD